MKRILSILGALFLVAIPILTTVSPVLADTPVDVKGQIKDIAVGETKQVDKFTKTTLNKVNYDKKSGAVVSKEYTAVISGLPQITDNGDAIDTQWYKKQDSTGQVYYQSGENLFTARVTENGRVSVEDSTTGRINSWTPEISLGQPTFELSSDNEIIQKSAPTVFAIDKNISIIDDPDNLYYRNNILVFTYTANVSSGGIFAQKSVLTIKRQVRVIEGCLTEKYIINGNPQNDLNIDYHSKGDNLASAELSKAIVFDSSKKLINLPIINEPDGISIRSKDFDNKTYPVIIDPTSSFTTSSYDGYLWEGFDETWAEAHDATSSDSTFSSSSATYLLIEASQELGNFIIIRSGLFFDTSSIQDDATITSAYIRLYSIVKYDTAGTWSVIVQSGMPTYPHTPIIMSDYNQSYYAGNGGSINSGSIGSGYNNLILGSTGLSWINKTSTTKFILRNSYDVNNTTPPESSTNGTYWQVRSYESGTGYAPLLSVSYTLPVVPPTGITVGSSSVGETSASLQGYITNDGGEACSVGFQYGTTTGYGSNSGLSSGYTTGQYFTQGITGLSRGTLYHYRAIISNSAGTGYGTDMTFTTLPAAPTNFQASAGNTTVSLSWTKGSGATNTMVRYSTTGYPTSIGDGILVYNSTGTSTNQTGTAGVPLYFSAWSSAGSGYSTTYVMAYAVPYSIGAPTTSTRDATEVTTTIATLNGYLDALNQLTGDVTVSFEYGDNTSYGSTAATGTLATIGSFYADITTLTPATTYHFRSKAVGTNGTGYGDDLTFTTGSNYAPTVTTSAASAVGLTYATLNGIIPNDGGLSCTVFFKYGLSAGNLINQTSSTTGIYQATPFYTSITGLTPNTVYYFQAVAQNSVGTGYGATANFTTSTPTDPIVTTNSATNIGASSGTLNGILTSDGGVPCEVEFEWDTDSGVPYANETGWQSGKTTGNTFSSTITGITPGDTVYFRAVAKNSTSTDNGTESSFLTVFTAPTNFTAKTLGASTIGLSWGKTGDQAYILYKTTGYPVDRLDGTQVYFGSATSYSHTSLIAGVTYFYQAWSWQTGDTWSGTSSEDAANTAAVLSGAEQINPEIDSPIVDSLYNPPSASKLTKIPGYGVLKAFVDDTGMPEGIAWMWTSIFIIMICCGGAFLLTKNTWSIILVGFIGLLIAGWIGTIPEVAGWIFMAVAIGINTLKGQLQTGER